MIKIMTKALTLLVRLVIIAMILTFLFITYQSVKHPEQPPSLLGFQLFTVLSNSMVPYFETGDMVIIKEVTQSDVNENDVITFKEENGKFITHRVIEIKNHNGRVQFVTQGDNNNVKDEEMVTDQNLVGKQVFLIPKAGYAVKFVSAPIGFILLVLFPILGYIFLELYERLKKSTKRGERPASE
ncbi:hypothetical protein AF332_24055 [Sporosarcina globispora]|uniref:Signal peptidase I n=1 Tax=Sporosarcina globispora TaxID=1459 RepID=A0A0M0GIC0_SPOGL|nr:signal peptidase I [Sporosarcina globispora]KON89594.1 hypothetical protein AF332_24055 [Sporosarcina globispora]